MSFNCVKRLFRSREGSCCVGTLKHLTVIAIVGVFAMSNFIPDAYAPPPRAVANREGGPQALNVVEAPSLLTPIAYQTSYAGQYPSYASFMQSPQSSSVFQQPYVPGSYSTATSNMPHPYDPYGATEVSPYSHYSPYVEIVGEGSDYLLGIDDVVTVIVRYQPDFSGRFVVDPDGNVQYQFVAKKHVVVFANAQRTRDI